MMNHIPNTLAILATGTTLALGAIVTPAQASIIGDSIDYSIGLQGAPDVFGVSLDPVTTGSFTASTTPSSDQLYNFSFSGINFNGTISFVATGDESIKVTWKQLPGLIGVPVGAVNALHVPFYLTLSDLDWLKPGPGTIVGASVDWVPGPPTTTRFGVQLPPTTPAPSVSFTADSVTLLFDEASLLQTIRSGSSATINLQVEHVPEPLTILGASTALAFGAGFKRKLGKMKK